MAIPTLERGGRQTELFIAREVFSAAPPAVTPGAADRSTELPAIGR